MTYSNNILLFFTSAIYLILLISLISNADQQQQQQQQQPNQPSASEQDFEELGLHYGKYLKEVVAALDKDQKFTETIKTMDVKDIKSGKVADQLKHVHEDVRKRLNELKYLEIKRLRDLATRKNEIDRYQEPLHGADSSRRWRTLGASLSQLPEHLGSHATFFDTKDLHKLMVAATNDLEKIDKERRDDFAKYEMEKEYQFQESLKMMNETQKQEAIRLKEELKKKHDQHDKIHHPGSQKQLEDVWVKKDHLPKEEFNPNTFFSLRDTDANNYWDQNEVRLLLKQEIEKLYDPNNPEDDPNEMEEEYNRMREHLYKEMDTDKDGLISRKEFLDYSHRPEFRRDEGWEDLSKQKAYTEKELEDYGRNRDKIQQQTHGYYNPEAYVNYPQQLHLPNWGLDMPHNAHPSQYYGYQVDPNHPQAQQMMQQQQQHMAYQQAAAYHQQAAGYQQPVVNYQQQPQHQLGQQPLQAQHQQQASPPPLQQQQMAYQQPQAAYHQQAAYQQPAVNYQQQQQPIAAPQQQQQPIAAIPQQQQPPQQQQQQPPPQQQQQTQQQQPQQQQAPPLQPPQQQQNFQAPPQQQQQQQPPPQQQQQQPQQQQNFQQPAQQVTQGAKF